LIACPYGRFQSVMLDRQSLIVAYDQHRGEPRRKGKRTESDPAGDCVDCNQCVVVCPTGIDIRDGLQLECVNCAQCIDACNHVMDRVGTPQGLIRFSSQDALDGKKSKLMRLRTIAYPLLLGSVALAFLAVLSTNFAFDAKIMRGRGNPFQQTAPGVITNNFTMRLTNRTDEPRQYTVTILEPTEANILDQSGEPIPLEGNGTELVPIVVEVAATRIGSDGQTQARVRFVDDSGNERELEMKLVGPQW